MDFLEHAIAWCKGEIFEARLILIFGIVVVISAFLFYKLGSTPGAKAMLFPLLVVGTVFIASGASMSYSNPKRIVEFQKANTENPEAFVLSEKERVEGFQYMYTMTLIIASAFFVVAMVLFWFTNNHTLKAIGIALVLFGLSGLVIDYFSSERADIYYEQIMDELKE